VKRIILAGLLIPFLLAVSIGISSILEISSQARPLTPNGPGSSDLITADQLRDYLTFIASDEMAGRDTPSKELDLAAKFLAMHLSRWGVKPAGDKGSYFQKFILHKSSVNPDKTFAEFNGARYDFGDAFIAPPNTGKANGEMVYVGHGWQIKSRKIDPYQGLNLKNKILIAHNGALPPEVNFNTLELLHDTGMARNVAEVAAANGAKGLMLIPDSWYLKNWATARQNVLTARRWRMQSDTSLPAITLSADLVKAVFQGEKFDGEAILKRDSPKDYGESFALSSGKKISMSIEVQEETTTSQNVVGVIEGSDPVLKNEYIAIGAHYDHVGTAGTGDCRAANGDNICNGADDDGSGTTAVMAIAEAFAKGQRLKRSLLFVWHAGEEKGLWGSEYFTDHPTIPLGQIITQLNIDMIGRSKTPGNSDSRNENLTGPQEIFVIGSKLMSSELGKLSETVNKNYLKLWFNYKFDDPNDSQRLFYRSDHYNYARKGIPIIFYFDGIHEDYHRPSDEVEKIDFKKMEKVTRTVYATAWELGNLAKRPVVDKPLPAQLSAN
jgi:hypothetical protein